MSAIFDAPIASYDDRVRLIESNQLALWDVLRACTRQGSLDQAIDKSSIVPNDFAAFLGEHVHISAMFFNGTAAHDIFMRHVWKNLGSTFKERLTLHKLPSTSPAMASMTRAEKIKVWQNAIRRAQGPRSHHADGV